MDDGGDVAVLQLLHASDLLFVLNFRLDAEGIQHDFSGHRGTAAGDIDVDALAVQVLKLCDVLAGEDVDLLVVQLGDVADFLREVGEHSMLLRVGQRISLDEAYVHAPEVKDVGEILQGALPQYRQHAERAVVQNRQVRTGPGVGASFHSGNDANRALIG